MTSTHTVESPPRTVRSGYLDLDAGLFTEDAVLDGAQGRHADRAALRAAVGPVWAAEGAASLHLTLNPVVEPGPHDGQALTRSVLLIIDPGPSAAIRTAAVITQELRQVDGSWRITRRTVTTAAGQH
jgi:SnoaL-like domain